MIPTELVLIEKTSANGAKSYMDDEGDWTDTPEAAHEKGDGFNVSLSPGDLPCTIRVRPLFLAPDGAIDEKAPSEPKEESYEGIVDGTISSLYGATPRIYVALSQGSRCPSSHPLYGKKVRVTVLD